MQYSTLLSVLAVTHALAAPADADSTAPAPAATDSAFVDESSLDTAVELADNEAPALEKRHLFLLAKAKWHWASALLGKGICWSCGSRHLSCGWACCVCGASTQVGCSTC